MLDGEPLFACQYLMARGHWQIVKHKADGKPRPRAASKTFALKEAPAACRRHGGQARARCIGDGLYGVDLKETDDGIFVIEVNDNPNLEHGVEDPVGKDEVWIRILNWFITGSSDNIAAAFASAATALSSRSQFHAQSQGTMLRTSFAYR